MTPTINQPFDLKGPRNLRELGGYPASDGRYTKQHVFLRSDALNELTTQGAQFLFDYGLRLVVDLRSRLAGIVEPDHLGREDIRDVHVPLYEGLHLELIRDDLHFQDGHTELTMVDMYEIIIDQGGSQVAKALHDLISCSECALFHCTAGKDRTGIIAMLLLEMAGVPRDIIIADYAESGRNASAELKRQEETEARLAGPFVPVGAFESKPEFMTQLLAHIDTQYGSVHAYLEAIGITSADMQRLENKFLTETKPDAAKNDR